MTTIKSIDTNETVEITYERNGMDALDDVIGNCGYERDDKGWLMSDEDMAWWQRWADRQEAIDAAYEDADNETRGECDEAAGMYADDMGMLQDVQERLLGIAE